MATFTYKTPHGDVDYTLNRRRRGGKWHYYFSHNSERYRERTGTIDLPTAKAVTEKEIRRVLQSAGLHHSLTIGDAVDQYLDDRWPDPAKRLNNQHYRDTKSRLNDFKTKHSNTPLASLLFEEALAITQKYVNERLKKLTSVSVDNDRRCLSRFYTWLKEKSLVRWSANPGFKRNGVRMTPPKRKIKPPAEADTVSAVMKAMKDKPLYVVLVLMQSGLRGIGCTRVLWTDLRLGEKPLVTITEKGETSTIPLSAWAAKELAEYKQCHPPQAEDDPVYPYLIDTARKQLLKARRELDPVLHEGLNFGAMRRLSYQRLYEADVSPQLAAKIMRSSVPTAMKHYVDLKTMTAHDAAEALSPVKAIKKPSTKSSTKKKPRVCAA